MFHRTLVEENPDYVEPTQPASMTIDASERFPHPCGFVRLKERRKVKAVRSVTNAQDRRCRIRRVILK